MPASPIYLDSEEEISELIERLRQTSGQDVPVVVPSRSRIGQSRFNFKLLRDYARQFGKRISIISPEPAIQHLAQENGFDAFADLDGFGAPDAEPALALAGVAAGYGSYAPPQALPPVAEPVPPAAPETRTPRMSMTPQRRLLANTGGSRGRMVLYAGAALIALVAFLAAAVLIPTASITLTAKAQALNDTANIDAAPGAAPVKIRQVTTTKSLSQQFTATGIHQTPAVSGGGYVTFTNSCPGNGGSAWGVKQGQIVNGSGVNFVLQTNALVAYGTPQSVTVLAALPGVTGNAAPRTITQINNNNTKGCLSVINPEATTGGTDEVKTTYISQGDLDSAKAALQGTLRGTIIDDLTKQAQSSEKLADTVDYVPSFTADHKADDVAPLFNGTVSMVGNGAVYTVDDVKAALKVDLAKHVPSGFALTDDPVQSDFHVSQSTADGHISFAGTAKGFIAPKLDFKKISNRLLGSNTASARIYLQTLPIEKADVKEKPFTLPVMPFLSSHIHINYVVDKGVASAVPPAQ
jgi:Baseplate J-like protein